MNHRPSCESLFTSAADIVPVCIPDDPSVCDLIDVMAGTCFEARNVATGARLFEQMINGGDTFHRVRSGPYSQDQVNRLRGRLKQNKISSLVIKLKN